MTTFNTLPPPQSGIPYAVIPPRPPFPTITQAVLLTLLLIGVQLVGGLFVGAIGLLLGYSQAQSMGAGALGLGNVLSFAAVFVIGIYWGKIPIRQALPLRPIPILLLFPIVITIIGLSPLLSEVDNLVRLVLPLPRFMQKIFEKLLLGDEGRVWQSVVLLAVIAPLTEEPIFRGLMLNGLLQGRRPWVAIVATAVLFALGHLNPWQFFEGLAAGLLFGWWFLRTRSLWPGIVGHAIYNSLPHIASTIPGLEIPGYTGPFSDAVSFQPLWFDLAGLAVFVVGLAWTRQEFRRMPGIPIARPVAPPPEPTEPCP